MIGPWQLLALRENKAAMEVRADRRSHRVAVKLMVHLSKRLYSINIADVIGFVRYKQLMIAFCDNLSPDE